MNTGMDGTYHVAHNGFLYYNATNSMRLIKAKCDTGEIVQEKIIDNIKKDNLGSF